MRLLLALVTLVAAGAACLLLPGYFAYLLATVATTTLVGVGLNVLLGLAGEVSLGQVGFVAIGAYAVGILTTAVGLGFWAALPLAVLLALVIGALLSVPALRLTGPYLAMVTIAFGFIVESVSVEWAGLTGGSVGLPGIPPPSLAGHGFSTGETALLSVLVCAAALWAFAWLKRSPLGLAMRAASAAPVAARSVGVALLPVRTLAFVVSAGLAGLAGGLQAPLGGFIAPSSFPFTQSILFLLVVVVGGAGTTLGPLVGAVLVTLLPELLSGLAEYRLLLFGAGLLLVLRLAPTGVVGALERRWTRAPTPEAAAPLPPAAAPAALEVSGLSVAFGGLKAVEGVGFTARPGAITSVIGPNGAGKTTLLNLISGFQAADRGSVKLGGAELAGLPAHATSRAGIARSWQTSQLFDSLSVGDNLRVAALRGQWHGAAPGVEALLALVGFVGGAAAESAGLPHVDRRLVEIARALATRPRALLLDEPAAGLDQADTARLGALLRRIAGTGVAVVLVEHDMGLVMQVSDHIVVLDAGRRIAEGTPVEIRANPAVREAYLGHGGAPTAPHPPRPAGETLLDAAALMAGYGALPVLRGLDLHVQRGEMVALLGPNGAGKSTLMKALSGLLRPVGGHVGFNGQRIAALPAHRVARAGLVLVPEGRQVFPQLSVEANLRLGATRRRDFDAATEIEAMLRRFPRLRERLHNDAGLLSGGEQQMLALARGLLARPEILLLDEPSLGLAPAVVDELFRQLAALRDEGMTLLLVDQMADLALSLADRCYVLGGGRILRHGTAAEMRDALDYFTGEDAA